MTNAITAAINNETITLIIAENEDEEDAEAASSRGADDGIFSGSAFCVWDTHAT
jgi:hypothetical protein